MIRRSLPYGNSWFQLAALTLVVSGAMLAVDYVPGFWASMARWTGSRAPSAPAPVPSPLHAPQSAPRDSASAEVVQGEAAVNDGKYKLALKLYRKAAATGNASAEYALGTLYDSGDGVAANYQTAIRWYEKSAASGQVSGPWQEVFLDGGPTVKVTGPPRGEDGIGLIYEFDYRQYPTAIGWFRKAAAGGDAWAEFMIGYVYKVQGMYSEALRSFGGVATGGSSAAAAADVEIGYIYLGKLRNYSAAARWYRAALQADDTANGGVNTASAEYWIGYMYENGLGVPRDTARALSWYRKAEAISDLARQGAGRIAGRS